MAGRRGRRVGGRACQTRKGGGSVEASLGLSPNEPNWSCLASAERDRSRLCPIANLRVKRLGRGFCVGLACLPARPVSATVKMDSVEHSVKYTIGTLTQYEKCPCNGQGLLSAATAAGRRVLTAKKIAGLCHWSYFSPCQTSQPDVCVFALGVIVNQTAYSILWHSAVCAVCAASLAPSLYISLNMGAPRPHLGCTFPARYQSASRTDSSSGVKLSAATSFGSFVS